MKGISLITNDGTSTTISDINIYNFSCKELQYEFVGTVMEFLNEIESPVCCAEYVAEDIANMYPVVLQGYEWDVVKYVNGEKNKTSYCKVVDRFGDVILAGETRLVAKALNIPVKYMNSYIEFGYKTKDNYTIERCYYQQAQLLKERTKAWANHIKTRYKDSSTIRFTKL